MSQFPEPWELEGGAAGAKKGNDRVKYALAHLKPGAPKVGMSANNSDDMQLEASALADEGLEEEAELWRSAMQRYNEQQEDDDYDQPPTLSELNNNDKRNQYDYERVNNAMDRMNSSRLGGLEIDDERSHTRIPIAQGEEIHGHGNNMESLSLWETFQLLYRKHPTVKFYAAALILLLIVAMITMGVSLSNRTSSSINDCAVADYVKEPFIILPDTTDGSGITFREFGSSIASSSEFLVIGAPVASSSQNITVGGGAFLYQRIKRGFKPFTRIIFDDGQTRNDKFGESVSISEDSEVVAVGAPRDDRLGVTAGAIYVIESPFSSSTPERLIPDDLSPNDEFGDSVSVSTTVLAGNIRVVNIVASSPSDDDFGLRSGSVYVFSKYYDNPPQTACGGLVGRVGEWFQCQKLLPDDGASLDRFGSAVAVSGTTIVVGAEWDKASGRESGSAYAFSLGDDGIWSLQEKITGWSNKPDRFGSSVSTSGNRIIIGADYDGSQGEGAGASYVYQLENGVWKLEQTFLPPSGSVLYRCGSKVQLSRDGEIVMIGCPEAGNGGIVYVYRLSEQGNSWVQLEKLSAADGGVSASATSNMMLGDSLAMSEGDNFLLVAGYGSRNGEVYTYRQDC